MQLHGLVAAGCRPGGAAGPAVRGVGGSRDPGATTAACPAATDQPLEGTWARGAAGTGARAFVYEVAVAAAWLSRDRRRRSLEPCDNVEAIGPAELRMARSHGNALTTAAVAPLPGGRLLAELLLQRHDV